MPEISRFFGIVIAMYHNDHDPPHFHVRYGEAKSRVSINELSFLDGGLSPRVRGMVIEWASQHLDELRRDWTLAKERKPLERIPPLE
ncbi:MAG: DUF4160 domain-containing protein [Phycisphaerae bacterium]|nr:DUF4160 domain-containing protein [Phycisphaerae bacterium]